jgi:hypothetical protein
MRRRRCGPRGHGLVSSRAQALSKSLSFATRSCGSRALLMRYCTSPALSGSWRTILYSPADADVFGSLRRSRTVCPDRNWCVIDTPVVAYSNHIHPASCQRKNLIVISAGTLSIAF